MATPAGSYDDDRSRSPGGGKETDWRGLMEKGAVAAAGFLAGVVAGALFGKDVGRVVSRYAGRVINYQIRYERWRNQ
jgi:hypothetical protein